MSLDGRDDLVVRVERSFERISRQRATRRPATGASLGTAPAVSVAPAVPRPPAPLEPLEPLCTVVAESRPDLASRLRRGLALRGIEAGVLASATEGRFTVVTTRLAAGAHEDLRALAAELGARVSSTASWSSSSAGSLAGSFAGGNR